jgi:hypothetical protein
MRGQSLFLGAFVSGFAAVLITKEWIQAGGDAIAQKNPANHSVVSPPTGASVAEKEGDAGALESEMQISAALAPQLDQPLKPRSLDELYALADPPDWTAIVPRLRLRLALEQMSAEELGALLDQNRSKIRGTDLAESMRVGMVNNALEEQAAMVDPMLLVDRLTARVGHRTPSVDALAALPTEE